MQTLGGEMGGSGLDYELISPISIPPSSRIPADQASTDEYDLYFRIERNDPSLLAWTRTCVEIEERVIDDLFLAGLSAEDRADLLLGLAVVQRQTLRRWIDLVEGTPARGSRPGSNGAGPPGDPPRLTPEQAIALQRWKLGHHLFHLYLVAMNSLIDATGAAVTEAKWDEVGQRLEALARLYRGATAGMRYAASFDVGAYATFIRPSMSAPFVNAGFSGQLNTEHGAMLQGLSRLRSRLTALIAEGAVAGDVASAASNLWAAQRKNRQNHMFVCRRFVPEGVSLLQQMYSEDEDPSE